MIWRAHSAVGARQRTSARGRQQSVRCIQATETRRDVLEAGIRAGEGRGTDRDERQTRGRRHKTANQHVRMPPFIHTLSLAGISLMPDDNNCCLSVFF